MADLVAEGRSATSVSPRPARKRSVVRTRSMPSRPSAAEKGITSSQLALAWVLSRGPDIVPIPGTKRVQYLEENIAAADVDLTREDLERIEAAVPKSVTSGERHPETSLVGL